VATDKGKVCYLVVVTNRKAYILLFCYIFIITK
jgi:hypothetical protein